MRQNFRHMRAVVAAVVIGCGTWVLAQAPQQPPARQGAPGVAQEQGRGRGQGRGARGPRTRKAVLAWADTRNGIAQHDSISHALAVIERLGLRERRVRHVHPDRLEHRRESAAHDDRPARKRRTQPEQCRCDLLPRSP